MKTFAHAPILLAVLAMPFAALSARAERPLVAAMPPGEEACYGRSYDGVHLAANPQQRILAFFFARLHTPDPEREDDPPTRESSIATAVESESRPHHRDTALQIMARLREPSRRYGGFVHCTSQDGTTLQCGAECDGGGLTAQVSPTEATLRMREHGVRVGPGCGEHGNIMLGANPADRTVRLARLPVEACLEARAAARPDWVRHGPPLRDALERRGTACFARRYDAAHLARVPGQAVAAIALRVTWRPEGEGRSEGLEISIRARLRDGSSNVASASCYATGYHFACEREGVAMHGDLILTRGPNGGVMLRSRPEEAAGQNEQEPPLAALLDLPLERSDDVFRLDAADAQACAD